MKQVLSVFLGVLFTFVSANVGFAAKKVPPTQTPSEECKSIVDESANIAGFDAIFETHSLQELTTGDAKTNLAVQYPTVVMNSFQKAYFALTRKEPRRILEPTYRVREVRAWPAFENGLPEAGNLMVVGQYRAIDTVIDYIFKGARGDTSALKILLLRGPAGTGKTEILNIITTLVSGLSEYDQTHKELTFEWKDLHKIPELGVLMGSSEGGDPILKIENHMQRSPIVLLPKSMQKKIVDLARSKVKSLIGLEPMPFGDPDPQTNRIIKTIVRHYAKAEGKSKVDEKFYIEVLSRHVNIVPREVDTTLPPPILRFQGKNPPLEQLFFDENLVAKGLLGSADPLSYWYNGKVLLTDGRVLGIDEFFRNVPTLRDLWLDLIQNRVVERGGAPAVKVDNIIIGSSNDTSIDAAMEEGSADAHLDRSDSLPMRLPTHPLEAAKIAVLMTGVKSFKMRPLDGKQIVPAKINDLFPLPTEDGRLQGPDKRIAVFYEDSVKGKAPVLIAPNSLLLLGLTTAGTRLVTDLKSAEEVKSEFDVVRGDSPLFSSPVQRLQLIMGELSANNATRLELDRLRDILKEGENGISARETQTWISMALTAARENDGTLTPAVIDQTFVQMLDVEKIKGKKRNKYLHIHNLMKRHFIVERLMDDLNAIFSGDGSRVESLYRELRAEIIALGTDEAAVEYKDASGERRPINLSRMTEIKNIYLKINGRELVMGQIKDFHVNTEKPGEQYLPLVRTIRNYLLKKQIDDGTIDTLWDAMNGRGKGEESTRLLTLADQSQERMGYNRRALLEALRFIRDMYRQEGRRK